MFRILFIYVVKIYFKRLHGIVDLPHFVDSIVQRNEISVEKYWRTEFPTTMHSRQLTRYIVLSLEPLLVNARPSAKIRGSDRKLRLAECVVARERDLGVNDTQFTCITHLGHLLREGDIVLG
jgi:nonsense-mediated mRNA decay protein 3